MRKLLYMTAVLCGLLYVGCNNGKNPPSPYSHAGLDSVLKKQVLFHNVAVFTDERLLPRGSAFLIRYENQPWVVTALPWIVQDTGLGATSKIGELKGVVNSWRIHPHVVVDAPKDTISAQIDAIQNMRYNEDILVMKANSDPSHVSVLTPQFALPATDDTLFVVGCPLEDPACKQNVYPLVFQKYSPKESLLSLILHDKNELNGFGGAPILNRNGEVVAVLVGGGKFLDLDIIYATHIAAIQEILK